MIPVRAYAGSRIVPDVGPLLCRFDKFLHGLEDHDKHLRFGLRRVFEQFIGLRCRSELPAGFQCFERPESGIGEARDAGRDRFQFAQQKVAGKEGGLTV